MIMTIMNFDEPIMRIEYDILKAKSEWLGPKHLKIPKALYPENITPKAVVNFCESRQPPRTRYDIEDLLRRKYKMRAYLPIQMCQKSRGITHSDDLWIHFDGAEKPKYADITVRDI